MTFDPTNLSNFLLLLTAWGGAFLAALWLSLVIWTYRDIKARGKDPLVRILAVLVVAVLFLPGIVIYLIVRPPRTLEEEYQNTLEEEALLQSIEEHEVCPGCSRRAKEDWRVCPHCQTKLKKACHHCSYLMALPWNICPHCGTPAPGMRRENLTLDEALQPLVTNFEPVPLPDALEPLPPIEIADPSLLDDYPETPPESGVEDPLVADE
jgi:RNA polymerase subunit RPABC4/transcription elongation factor Spt4